MATSLAVNPLAAQSLEVLPGPPISRPPPGVIVRNRQVNRMDLLSRSFPVAGFWNFPGSFRDGGDGGTVWAVLYGLQFRDGLSVKLTRQGESDIIGTSVSVGSDGRSIGVVFNLSGLSVKASAVAGMSW
jgi:hypothetical protein